MHDDLALRIAHSQRDSILRVAVDGPDAAGKTTLADALATRIARHRPVVRVSIDGFHRPRAVRTRRGDRSPEGYYQDSFDYDAIRRWVLVPLGPDGDRWYRRAVFHYRADTALDTPVERAPAGAVLLFDGGFLQRPELRDHWDLRIYVDVAPAEAVRRAQVRDTALFGDAGEVQRRYHHRYLPGQRLYRERCQPIHQADAVIDNNDPHHPVLTWNDRSSG